MLPDFVCIRRDPQAKITPHDMPICLPRTHVSDRSVRSTNSYTKLSSPLRRAGGTGCANPCRGSDRRPFPCVPPFPIVVGCERPLHPSPTSLHLPHRIRLLGRRPRVAAGNLTRKCRVENSPNQPSPYLGLCSGHGVANCNCTAILFATQGPHGHCEGAKACISPFAAKGMRGQI